MEPPSEKDAGDELLHDLLVLAEAGMLVVDTDEREEIRFRLIPRLAKAT